VEPRHYFSQFKVGKITSIKIPMFFPLSLMQINGIGNKDAM
jgi:hypothetical protein